MTNDLNSEHAKDGLKALRTVLGIDSPETRGWAPMVQQSARMAIDCAIRTLTAQAAELERLRAAEAATQRALAAGSGRPAW